MKLAPVALVALVPLLSCCASTGLYNMSDDWCNAHLEATAARCPRDGKRLAHNDKDSERTADKVVAQSN